MMMSSLPQSQADAGGMPGGESALGERHLVRIPLQGVSSPRALGPA